MSLTHTLVQVAPGVQCFVGDEARKRRAIERLVVSVFEGWDYEEIIPPLYDYADVFSGPALESRTYSFVGRDGSLLALRPDFTSLIAKVAAGRLSNRPAPIRLYYSGEVLRYEPPKAGRQSELFQMGLEHLGGESRAADAEVLAVAAECLDALGVIGSVLTLGHVGIFGGLSSACGLKAPELEVLRERVEAKDADGVAASLRAADAPSEVKDALVGLTELAGGSEILEAATAVAGASAESARALSELSAVVAALTQAGLGERLAVDLAEVRGLDYYTGLVFRAYAPGLGFEVGSGGRYDALSGRFGRPMPAVGFMIGLDRMALLLERQKSMPGTPPPVGESIDPAPLGEALKRARECRQSGGRVRFGNGGKS